MTDQEVAELIASHPGWVELAKKYWAWKIGDWGYDIDLARFLDGDTDEPLFIISNSTVELIKNGNWNIVIPVPREDQLMNMLKSKLGYEDIRFYDLRTERENEEQTCLKIYVKDYEVAKYMFDAPTRLLALFAAVVKVYGLDGKAE